MRRLLMPLAAVVALAGLLTLLGREDPPRRAEPASRAAADAGGGSVPITGDMRPEAPPPPRETIRLNVPPTIVDPDHRFRATPPSRAAGEQVSRPPASRAPAVDSGAAAPGDGPAAAPEEAVAPLHYAGEVPPGQGERPYAQADTAAVQSPSSRGAGDAPATAAAPRELSPELKQRLAAVASRGEAARSWERDAGKVAAVTRMLAPDQRLDEDPAARLVLRQATAVPTVTMEPAPATLTLRGVGAVTYDPTAVHDVNITASGLVEDVYFFEGMIIEEGEPLLDMFAPERLLAQYNHLANIGNEDRLSYSFTPGKFLEDSRSNLRWWGMSDEEIELVEEAGTVIEDYVIRAPRTGYVLERRADRGSLINAGAREMEDWALVGDTVARVADLSRVWVTVELAMDDIAAPLPFGRLEQGMPVEVVIAEVAGDKRFVGRIDHVFARVPTATRRLRARVVLDNPDLALLPGMYAHLELTLAGPKALRVPASALLYDGGETFVLVAEKAGVYALRRVITGARHGGVVVVLAGLATGDTVAANARMLVDPDRQLLWAAGGSAP